MELKDFNELLKDGEYVAWDDVLDQKIQFFIRSSMPMLRPKKMDDFWLSLFFPDLMDTLMGNMRVPAAVQRKVWRAMILTAREKYRGIVDTSAPAGEEELVDDVVSVEGE